MKKGEIWFVHIPSSDGREQSGTRPVLLMADTATSMTVVIPFTTNLQALRFPNTLEIQPSQKNGLEHPSIALVFQLRAIDRQRFVRKIGEVDAANLQKIDVQVRKLLGL